MYTNHYYGFGEYWNLFHSVTFDGPNKLILVNQGEVSLDVKVDLYSDWKEWSLVESHVNTKYEQAFSVVGGDPTIAGEFLDATFFLLNGWKLKPYPGSYQLTIDGNLFDVAGANYIENADINPDFPNNILINTNTSVIVRQVTPLLSGSYDANVTASLDTTDRGIIVEISGSIVSIESLLVSQGTQITDIQNKLIELWTLHGLDVTNRITVTKTKRTDASGSIDQDLITTGEGATQQTILTRN